jgi:CheY-like chemotaxis protein
MPAQTILIIDDDPRNVFALSAVLRARGYKILSAHTAADGIDLLLRNPDLTVILMDMMMPEMDGYEAVSVIRKLGPGNSVPIIAVTAQAMPGDRERCLDAGADDYISKPVDIDILVRLLQKHV